MAEKIPSTHSWRLRSASVSSMRSTNVPPDWRATNQLNSAVRALPTWKYPVGDGAKRTLGASLVTPRLLVFDDGDGAGRAAVCRLADLLAQLLARVLVQHVEVPVVTHLEDLRSDPHADGVAGTLVEVDNNLHVMPPAARRQPECTGPPARCQGTGGPAGGRPGCCP